MTSTVSAFTKVLVADPQTTTRFYEALGFTRVGTDGTFVQLRWPAGGDLMLVHRPAGVRLPGPVGLGVLLGFVAPEGVDALVERATAVSATVEGPSVQPWHTREVIITDPDGYRLNFIEPAGS